MTEVKVLKDTAAMLEETVEVTVLNDALVEDDDVPVAKVTVVVMTMTLPDAVVLVMVEVTNDGEVVVPATDAVTVATEYGMVVELMRKIEV